MTTTLAQLDQLTDDARQEQPEAEAQDGSERFEVDDELAQQSQLYWQERAFRLEAWLGRNFGAEFLRNFRKGYDLPVPNTSQVDGFTIESTVRTWKVDPATRDHGPLFKCTLVAAADQLDPYFSRFRQLMDSSDVTASFAAGARQQRLFDFAGEDAPSDIPPEPEQCSICGASSLDELMMPEQPGDVRSAIVCMDRLGCKDRFAEQHPALAGGEKTDESAEAGPDVADEQQALELEAHIDNGKPALDDGFGQDAPPPEVNEDTLRRIHRRTRAAAATAEAES